MGPDCRLLNTVPFAARPDVIASAMESPRARTFGRATPWVLVVVCAFAAGMPPVAILPFLLGIGLTSAPATADLRLGVAAVEPADGSGTSSGTVDAAASRFLVDREAWVVASAPRPLRAHLRVARSTADLPFALPPTRAPCA